MANICNTDEKKISIIAPEVQCEPDPCTADSVGPLEAGDAVLSCDEGVTVVKTYEIPPLYINEGTGIDIEGDPYDSENPLVVSTNLCELDVKNEEEVESAVSVTYAGCVDGETVQMPPPTFDLSLIPNCALPINGEQDPNAPAPAPGEPWVHIDCNNQLWFWSCSDNQWVTSEFPLSELEPLEDYDVATACQDLNFLGWCEKNGCITSGSLTLEELSCLVASCILENCDFLCAMLDKQQDFGTVQDAIDNGVITDASELNYLVNTPDGDCGLITPSGICDDLQGLEDLGTTQDLIDAGTIQETADLNFPTVLPDGSCAMISFDQEECCDCYAVEDFGAGGGVCFDITSSPTVEQPVIFQGRDLTFIQGAGVNDFDQNGLGIVTNQICNPSDTCPTSVIITASFRADRSLTTANVGLGFAYMVSETIAEPYPYPALVGGASTNHIYNPPNVGYTSLGFTNNLDVAGAEAFYTNYNSEKPGAVIWKTTLAPGQCKNVHMQWWALLSAIAGTNGATGVVVGHGVFQATAEYNIGGTLLNTVQI